MSVKPIIERMLTVTSLLLVPLAIVAIDRAPPHILVFGDSNSWGTIPLGQEGGGERYADAVRWGGVLASKLANRATVTIDGQEGRTVDIDQFGPDRLQLDPVFTGSRSIAPALYARHADMVIIMLGTNDVRSDLARRPAAAIARSLSKLAHLAQQRSRSAYPRQVRPTLLLIAPPTLGRVAGTPMEASFDDESIRLSKQLPGMMKIEAAKSAIATFDANRITSADGADGVHLSAAAHRRLGQAVAVEAGRLLAQGRADGTNGQHQPAAP